MRRMKYYLGIDVGGTKIAYGLFDENHVMVDRSKENSNDQLSGEVFFGQIAQRISAYRKQVESLNGTLEGVGIGLPGFVDFEHGRVSKVSSLPKLHNFPVVDFLKSRIGEDIPIVADNDCHCGALAEYRHGAGRGHRHMLFCPVSTGISTGIIIDGKLFRGSNGASGESGHMVSGVSGPDCIPCACGNSGCFNSLGSGKAITFHIRNWIAAGEKTVMTELAGSPEKITAFHINQAYDMGDPMAKRAIAHMAHYLAMWLFGVYMILNVDCIVFSGGLLAMGDKLFKPMLEEFEKYHTNGFPVHFYNTQLGSDAGLIGAVELLF